MHEDYDQTRPGSLPGTNTTLLDFCHNAVICAFKVKCSFASGKS